MNFTELIDLTVQTTRLRDHVLYSNNVPYRHESYLEPLPQEKLFSFELQGDKVRWEFVCVAERPWGGSVAGSMVGLGGCMTFKEMESVRHELTGQVLFGRQSTDKKLSTIARLNQPSDNLTPDMIIELNEVIVVVELGTTQSNLPGAVVALYNEKNNKYMGYLKELSNIVAKPIYYIVVAVGQNMVCSSIELSDNLVNDLIYRMKMGLRFERAYQASGIRKVQENQESAAMVNLRSSLKTFSTRLSHSGCPGFDKVTHQEWSQHKPDLDYLEKMEDFILEQTASDVEALKQLKPLDQVNSGFQFLEDEIKENGGIRKDKKSPVQMLLVIPDRLEGCQPTFEVVPNEANELSEIAELWNICTMDGVCHQERFYETSLEEEVEYALGEKSLSDLEKKRSKRDFHRVSMAELSESSRLMLAMDGMQAKKYFSKDETKGILQERREYTQTSFRTDCWVSDIEETVGTMPNAMDISEVWPEWESVSGLIDMANKLQNNDSLGKDTVTALLNTDISAGLLVIASIAAELSVSHKQNCRPNEMIYKRINGLALEMLVYPTRSSSHLFFSLRYKGRTILHKSNATFRTTVRIGEWEYTPVMSIDSSRLENMIKAPFTWLNNMVHWRIWYSKLKKDDVSDQFNDAEPDVVKLSWISVLISLEDKSTTEELVTSIRYISMNFFKGLDESSPMNLIGAIKKMPTVLRSRLAVYLFQSIKQYCILQATTLPEFNFKNLQNLREDRNGDNWDNLICPYLLKPIDNCQCIIQLFYVGYVKNKNTTPSENSDYSLIKKIIAHVVNKTDSAEKAGLYDGTGEPSPKKRPGPHEFSKNAFSAACDIAADHLIKSEGRDYKTRLDDQILHELVHKSSYEAMATLKASFNYDSDTVKTLSAMKDNEDKLVANAESKRDYELMSLLTIASSRTYFSMTVEQQMDINKQIINLKKRNGFLKKIHDSASRSKSCKCHEAVIKAMSDLDTDSCLPLQAISQVYDSVLNTWGGVCCYLFKKAQHGGIREIYVLTFYSRLLQLFVETVGRVLCSHFPLEVMTHPNEKTNAIHRHFAEVKKTQMSEIKDISSLTRASSEDKSKWSQNNNVSCYSFILSRLLSPDMAKCCIAILKLWKSKKILLPDGVLKLLEHDIEKQDSAYESLRAEYWGRAPPRLLEEKGGRFLVTDTGMWQGILHYLSSFQHVLQVLHFQNFFHRVFGPMLNQEGSIENKMTNLVSSDDSLTLLTVTFRLSNESPDELEEDKIRRAAQVNKIMAMALFCEDLHSSFFMMNESPKSCMASSTVFEFNSIFHIAQGAVSPVIKKVLCCTNIVQSESFIVKARSSYNAIKDILEEGGSHMQVHMHQIVCGLLHYFVMGSTTTALFSRWAEMIMKNHNPNPHLGFFILDVDLVAGLMGYEFSQFSALINTEVACLVPTNLMIKNASKGLYANSVLFMHGNRKRWEKLKERVLEPGWESQVDENPEILYKAFAETKDEAKLRLSMKACSKGVYEALVVGGKLASIVAASVYMMREPVMTVRTTDFDDEVDTSLETTKTLRSLLYVTSEMSSINNSDFSHLNMNDDQKALVYPNHHLYELVMNLVTIIREETMGVDTMPYRRVKNTITLRTLRANSKLPLMTCCRKKWFGMMVKSSRTLIEDSWAYYKTMFSWLNDDIELTLQGSPFNSHSEMYRFIQGLQESTSTARILSKRLSSNQTYGKIKESILYNNYPGHKLTLSKTGKDKVIEDTAYNSGNCREFQSLLNLILMHPAGLQEKMDYLKGLIEEQSFEFSDSMLVGLNPAECRQVALLAFLSGLDQAKVIEILSKTSGHMITYFSIPQTKTPKGYRGYGCLTMAFKDFKTESHFFDDRLILQTTTDLKLLRMNHTIICEELQKAGIRIPDGSLDLRPKRNDLPNSTRVLLKWDNRPRPEYCFTVGGLWAVTSSESLPYAEVKVIPHTMLSSDPDHLELVVVLTGEQQISLQATAINGQFTHLCRFNPLSRTRPTEDLVDLWDRDVDADSDLESWALNQPRNKLAIVEELKTLHAKHDMNLLSNQDNQKINFFRRTLLNRAVFRHKLNRTLRLADLETNLENILETDLLMTENDIEMVKAINDETVTMAKTIAASSCQKAASSYSEVVKNRGNSAVSEWVNKHQLVQRSPSRESIMSAKELSIIEDRLNAGVRIDTSDVSADGDMQSYFLHHYWDDFIDLMESFGIWTTFKESVVLPSQLKPTCEIVSWLIDRPNYAKYEEAPF